MEFKRAMNKFISSDEKDVASKFYVSKKLSAKINAQNKGEIYFIAEEFCKYKCIDPNAASNPMITCVNVCPIWFVKSKAR